MGRRSEELGDLQRQLTSIKVECEKLQTDAGKETLQSVIEHCLTESLDVAWVLKQKKRHNKDLQTQLQRIQETQNSSTFFFLIAVLSLACVQHVHHCVITVYYRKESQRARRNS